MSKRYLFAFFAIVMVVGMAEPLVTPVRESLIRIEPFKGSAETEAGQTDILNIITTSVGRELKLIDELSTHNETAVLSFLLFPEFVT